MMVLDLDKNQPAMILDLTKDLPDLKNILGSLQWDPHPLHGTAGVADYDLDIFLFGTDANGKVFRQEDIMYFKNKFHKSGAYSVPVDNQNGVDTPDGDPDEYFMAHLDKFPADLHQLHVWVFIHDAVNRGQSFGKVANTRFDLYNADLPKNADGSMADPVVRYLVNQDFKNETCLHVATIARANGGWEIRPVGTAGVFNPNEVLGAYC